MNTQNKLSYNLEGGANFGSDKLNSFYEKLDKSVQAKIKTMNKESSIQLLEIMSNPNIQQVYDGLTAKEKADLKKMGIVNKYTTLKKMLDKKVADTTFVLSGRKTESHDDPSISNFGPKTPSFSPPREPESSSLFQKEKKVVEKEEIKEVLEKEVKEVLEEEEKEVDEENEKEDDEEKKKNPPQLRFENIVKTYYDNNRRGELEVKFGTKGIKSISKNNYDNVVRKLKSAGFHSVGEENGEYYLRVNCEFLDSNTGRFKMSNIRTDIRSLSNIQEFCKTNDIKHLPNELFVEHMTKGPMFINKQKIFPVDFDDFNFRITYNEENIIRKMGIINDITENWRKSKKEFRFINRVTFEHTDYPFKVDISIVKYGNRQTDKFGRGNRGPIIRAYTLDESNVLNNEEIYEIELEVDPLKIGPGTKFNTPQLIVDSLRKGIKYVLSGMQGTNYPISYPEQKSAMDSCMKMIWKNDYDTIKYVSSRYFIGPNSYTLQMENIAATDENSNAPNIRKGFVVTDKADGERNLLYISSDGKIYFINTNMDVIFTGAKTDNAQCFNSLLDGELISHDKVGKFINLYAAFDIYFINKEDVRSYTFLQMDTEKDSYKSRYNLLQFIRQNLNAVDITNLKKATTGKKGKNVPEFKVAEGLLSPLRFSVKEFFPNNSKQSIFEGCMQILQKQKEERFEYETDGLIFTHAFYGVGSGEIGKAGPREKITWEYSFKWKPPQYNTIDFLVTTEKGPNGDDIVKPFFEDGQNNSEVIQLNEYKKIVLRCGFSEKKDGFINPCQDIIDDNLPELQTRYEDRHENDYIPQRFYPTEPYDSNAGLCNIMLRMDGSGAKKMFSEENQVFEDNTIVEFRYDLTKEEGWKWIPLRVRYDKTSRLHKGEKEYGNAYHVCNSNWKSIHPTGRITADMLSTGQNIPDLIVSEDKYYNTPAGKFKTEKMKQFHNLYVKKHLIVGVGKQGDTLIDFACGKAGDISKWIASKLSFVFGIDISKDNLENRLDGACARFLKSRKSNKHVPYALFVNGNSAYNIKDGSAMLNEKAKQITEAVFGKGKKIGAGVARQYGKGVEGFNISSCQFAAHYFFENPDTLKGFMKNIAECTKHNGYFIGTAYDGKQVFNELRKTKYGESIQIVEDGRKIWEVTKGYSADTFDDDSSSIGYRIDVFQESINQTISEYLINFDYFNRVMTAYGFEIISREEAVEMGLPEGSGMFSELFLYMLDEIARNKYKAKDYGESPMMSEIEKKISFLNRYFVYKKIRVVNTDAIELELGEYNETASLRDKKETKHAVKVAEEEDKKQTNKKVRKLSKKMLLIPGTEAIDEQEKEKEKEKEQAIPEKKVKKSMKVKAKPSEKLIIIESDEDE
jgi:hypothetical protein